jgi:hypothetical protein
MQTQHHLASTRRLSDPLRLILPFCAHRQLLEDSRADSRLTVHRMAAGRRGSPVLRRISLALLSLCCRLEARLGHLAGTHPSQFGSLACCNWTYAGAAALPSSSTVVRVMCARRLRDSEGVSAAPVAGSEDKLGKRRRDEGCVCATA